MLKFCPNISFWHQNIPNNLAKIPLILQEKNQNYHGIELLSPLEFPIAQWQEATKLLPIRLFNIAVGDWQKQKGIGALKDSQENFRNTLETELNYALQLGVDKLHFMAGLIDFHQGIHVFYENIAYILEKIADKKYHQITILIEPINKITMPNYMVNNLTDAIRIIDDFHHPQLKLQFDVFHIGMMGLDILANFRQYFNYIGHVQVATIPHRLCPFTQSSAFDYQEFWQLCEQLGYDQYIGCEYYKNND